MKRNLDRIDYKILTALQKNGRLSNKELAAQVGLAPSSCLERVRRLREDGVLQGFHAEVEPAALGLMLQAMVAVRMRYHSKEMFTAFQNHLMSRPEVTAAYHLAGADDFLVHVAVRDANHLRDLVMEAFSSRPEVERLETALIFDHMRSPELPSYVQQD